MAEGQWAFLDSKGPRKKITLLVSPEAYLLLKVASSTSGGSPTGKAVEVVERWAAEFLEQNADSLGDSVSAERTRRAPKAAPVQAETSSGRSMQSKRGE